MITLEGEFWCGILNVESSPYFFALVSLGIDLYVEWSPFHGLIMLGFIFKPFHLHKFIRQNSNANSKASAIAKCKASTPKLV